MRGAKILATAAFGARIIVESVFPAQVRDFGGAVLSDSFVFKVDGLHSLFTIEGLEKRIRTRRDNVKVFGARDVHREAEDDRPCEPI